MRRSLLALVVSLVLALLPQLAEGQLGCNVSAPTMNLGSYTGALSTSGSTVVTVSCLLTTSYTVALNQGVGAGATTTVRKMTGPGPATLSYQLFQNTAHTTNWGNNNGVDTLSGFTLGLDAAQTWPIYPEVAAGQTIAAGTYNDTITITTSALLNTVTSTFQVTATVPTACTIASSGLNFGNYSGTLLSATSTLTVTCTDFSTFNIGLNAGTSSGATVTTRKMTSAASAKLNYSLFRDSSQTLNWGNTVGTDTFSAQGTGTAMVYNVYGQVPAGQFVTPAVYTDTIIATITY